MHKTLAMVMTMLVLIGCSDDSSPPPAAANPANPQTAAPRTPPDKGPPPAPADAAGATGSPEETPAAGFARGMKLYEEGNYAEARAVLVQVNGMLLSKDDRITLWETIQQLDQKLKDRPPR